MMYYEWNDGTDYLMHHGIKGQKWGIRRYQNPDGTLTEAGKARLNKYRDAEYARVDAAFNKRAARRQKIDERLNAKRDKKIEKGKSTSRIDSKIANNTKLAVNDALATSVEQSVIKSMSYSQMQKEKKAVIAAGAAAVIGSMATIGLSAVGKLPFYMIYKPDIYGMLRNMRMDSFNKTAENKESFASSDKKKQYTNQNKEQLMSNAKNNNMYDLDFLESIQNSKIAYDNDTKAILKEYSKYLDDPEKYWTEDSRKLKQA